MRRLKVLIVGATGLIGSHLLKACLEDSDIESVSVIGRKLDRLGNHPKLKKFELAFEDLDRFDEPLDICFCCLGTTIKKAGSKELFRKVDKEYPLILSKRFKAISPKGKFLVVSAMGADPSSSIFYNQVKGEMENGLKEMNLGSLMIFRPSLLLGERSEKRSIERLGQIILPLLPLPKNYKAVPGETVAKKMLAMSKVPPELNEVETYLNEDLFE